MADARPAEWRQLSGLGAAAALLDPLRDQGLVGTGHPAQFGQACPLAAYSGPLLVAEPSEPCDLG